MGEMSIGEAITLNVYNSEDELIKEMHRNIIPWGVLKQALRMAKKFGKVNAENMTEEDLDLLSGFVLLVFNGQCTKEELENGVSVPEMLTVLQSIMARATQAANPTLPKEKRKRK